MIAMLPTLTRIAAFALPVLIALAMVLYVRRRQSAAAAIADRHLFGRLSEADLLRVPVFRVLLILLAAIAIGAALLLGDSAVDDPAAEAPNDIVLLLDASGSMLGEDVQTAAGMESRLGVERAAAREIITFLGGSSLGLVVFAGDAFILSPQTYDYAALQLYLDALDPSVVSQTGSSLASAIRQGAALVASSEGASGGALVLISDGDALEPRDSVTAAARMAGELGIRIHTVGVGDATGAAVPDIDPGTGVQVGFKHEPDGSLAVSALNEPLLREISAISGGEYFYHGQDGSIDRLLSELSVTSPAVLDQGSRWRSIVQWLLIAALLLLGLEMLPAPGTLRRAAVFLFAAILASGCGPTDSVGSAEAAFEKGDHAAAAAAYARAAEENPQALALSYNLGTALLWGGRFEEARPHLEQAARGDSAASVWRAHYNSGNTDLVPAFRGRTEGIARERVARAAGAYRNALRIDPTDVDAKWNLELALRMLEEEKSPTEPENPEESGGGGVGGGGGTGGADLRRPASPSDPQPRPSPAEAARILDAAQEREVAVQREALEKSPPPTPPIRGW